MSEPGDGQTRDGGGDAVADNAVLDELSLVFGSEEQDGESDDDTASSDCGSGNIMRPSPSR